MAALLQEGAFNNPLDITFNSRVFIMFTLKSNGLGHFGLFPEKKIPLQFLLPDNSSNSILAFILQPPSTFHFSSLLELSTHSMSSNTMT